MTTSKVTETEDSTVTTPTTINEIENSIEGTIGEFDTFEDIATTLSTFSVAVTETQVVDRKWNDLFAQKDITSTSSTSGHTNTESQTPETTSTWFTREDMTSTTFTSSLADTELRTEDSTSTNRVTDEDITSTTSTFNLADTELRTEDSTSTNRVTDEDITSTTSTFNNDEIDPEEIEKITRCIENCPVTPEYNPVCGTDFQDYTNIGRLECAKACGVDVSLRRRSRCPPPPENEPVIPPTEPTTTVIPKPKTDDYETFECMKSCALTYEYNPVCGTLGINYLTYDNIGILECAQSCGVEVDLFQRSKCPSNLPAFSARRIFTGGGFSLYERPNIVTTTPSTIEACIKSCQVTSEYRPVCGSNLVRYNNPGRLLCAQWCGVDVYLLQEAPCPWQTPVPPVGFLPFFK